VRRANSLEIGLVRQVLSFKHAVSAGRRPGFGFVGAITALATTANFAFAQQPTAPATAPSAAATLLDAKAIGALTAMGKYLRSLKSFTLHADTAIDEVLTTGQKIQFAGSLDYTVAFPNRLRAEVRSDRRTRDYYFDGKSLTQYAPRMNYYATIAAPGTLSELVQVANQKFGLPLPLADLFLWGTDKSGVEDITAASYFGPARIGGRDCSHFAYRQPNVDWQIWIEKGARPLPCKIVITTTDEPAQPQYAAVLKWDVAPKLQASTFVFTPPKDARRIEMATVQAAVKN
jgi:hypothetical protein